MISEQDYPSPGESGSGGGNGGSTQTNTETHRDGGTPIVKTET